MCSFLRVLLLCSLQQVCDKPFWSPVPSIRGFRDFVFLHQRNSLTISCLYTLLARLAFLARTLLPDHICRLRPALNIYTYIGINVAYSYDLIPLSTLEPSLLAINMLPDKLFALLTPQSCRRILRNLRPTGDCAIALFHYNERVSPKPASVLHSFLAIYAHTHL